MRVVFGLLFAGRHSRRLDEVHDVGVDEYGSMQIHPTESSLFHCCLQLHCVNWRWQLNRKLSPTVQPWRLSASACYLCHVDENG